MEPSELPGQGAPAAANDTAASVLPPHVRALLIEEQAGDEAALANLERMRRDVMERIKRREGVLYPGRKPRKAAERIIRIDPERRAAVSEAQIAEMTAKLARR
jgi:DnaJ-domain-containing protein 1